MLVYAKGGIAKTLSQAFPEIGLIQSKFDINCNSSSHSFTAHLLLFTDLL